MPACRWRSPGIAAGLVRCASAKLVAPPAGFPEAVCRGCYCRDHEPAGPRKPLRAARRPRPPCKHLGEPTGEARACKSCGGNVRVKVFGCAKHGSCTVGRPAGVACCEACDDHTPAPPAPKPAPAAGAAEAGSAPKRGRRFGMWAVPADPTWPTGPGILLTAGIGDLYAIEARMTPADRARVEAVFYACAAVREQRALMEAAQAAGAYPNLRHHVVLDTGRQTCYSKAQVERRVGRLPAAVEDWSPSRVFPAHKPFAGGTFAAHTLADVPAVPGPYVVVVSHSSWGRHAGRDFDQADWKVLLDFLDREQVYGVVLSRETPPVPVHGRLIDLQGRTTILESVELVKRAAGYVGIDSNLSCLAAQVFPATRLAIKGHNSYLLAWLGTYFGPHEAFPFVSRHLTAPEWHDAD